MFPGQIPLSALSALVLHTFKNKKLNFPASCGRFVLTGGNCPAQSDYNAFDHAEEPGQGFLVRSTGYEAAQLWFADGSQKGVKYWEKRKSRVVGYKRTKLISIPANSVSWDTDYYNMQVQGVPGRIEPVPHLAHPGSPSYQGCRCIRVWLEFQESG